MSHGAYILLPGLLSTILLMLRKLWYLTRPGGTTVGKDPKTSAQVQQELARKDEFLTSQQETIIKLQAALANCEEIIAKVQQELAAKDEFQASQRETIMKLEGDLEQKDLALLGEQEINLKLQGEVLDIGDKLWESTAALAKERKTNTNLQSQKRELVLALLWERTTLSNLKDSLRLEGNASMFLGDQMQNAESRDVFVTELQEHIGQRDKRISCLERGLELASHHRRLALIGYLPDPRTLSIQNSTTLGHDDFFFQAVQELMLKSVVSHRKGLNSKQWSQPARLQVLEVEMVQSPALLDSYISQRSLVQQRRQSVRAIKDPVVYSGGTPVLKPFCRVAAVDPKLNEALLFHGAAPQCLDQIVTEGFDPQRGGENAGAMYGIGTYFAHNVSKCDVYSKSTGTLVKEVLLSRVLLGEAFLADRALGNTIKRPPDGYDSVVALTRSEGGQVDHREYVIFNPSRACPMFRIKYKHMENCQCHQCG